MIWRVCMILCNIMCVQIILLYCYLLLVYLLYLYKCHNDRQIVYIGSWICCSPVIIPMLFNVCINKVNKTNRINSYLMISAFKVNILEIGKK